MSSTPLFDSIARSAERSTTRPAVTTQQPVAAPQPAVARLTVTPAPSSPMTAPVAAAESTVVPCDLVQAIDDIPARLVASAEREFHISDEQRALVEAIGDTFIRVVVDTLATELERIVRDRTVRA